MAVGYPHHATHRGNHHEAVFFADKDRARYLADFAEGGAARNQNQGTKVTVPKTWNYRHLAGVDREARIALANVSSGFTKPLRLITPLEVAYP